MNVPAKPTPELAPPGAGLPKIERFAAGLMIRWRAARTSRPGATALFAREWEVIRSLLHGRDTSEVSEPVLINRLPGLEDSSRYWSLLMVLDHLRIVNADITEVIACLTSGRLPGRAADIARVKPRPAVGHEVIGEFEAGCGWFADTVAGVGDLKTALKFDHPWFGPMDAAAWHFMAGFHMQLHRKQMERILAGLPKAGA